MSFVYTDKNGNEVDVSELFGLKEGETSKQAKDRQHLQQNFFIKNQHEIPEPIKTLLFEIATNKNWSPYHPGYDGPLTMKKLDELTEREFYKEKGFTKLMIAVWIGDSALVLELLKGGEDPKMRDRVHNYDAFDWARDGPCPEIGLMMSDFLKEKEQREKDN
jgi:hypothetical protein